jgi:hypothetical protein
MTLHDLYRSKDPPHELQWREQEVSVSLLCLIIALSAVSEKGELLSTLRSLRKFDLRISKDPRSTGKFRLQVHYQAEHKWSRINEVRLADQWS